MTWRRRLRSWLCIVINGRHEFYPERDALHLYQRCVLCGHETHGWELDRPKGKP